MTRDRATGMDLSDQELHGSNWYEERKLHYPYTPRGLITPEALNWAGNLLLDHHFVFAKTMPSNPHWYTVRRKWHDVGENMDEVYDEVVRLIREHGYTEYFANIPWRMLNVNGSKYWTYYSSSLRVADVLNRKPLMMDSAGDHAYDEIAPMYDMLMSEPAMVAQRRHVLETVIGDLSHSHVLDLGCGTGALLDTLTPQRYTGIDPSRLMLERLWEKHPTRQGDTVHAKLEEFVPRNGPYDVIVALFGSASYMETTFLDYLPNYLVPGGRYVLMFQRPGTIPVAQARTGVDLAYQDGVLTSLPGVVTEYGDYIIVDGMV